MNIPDPGWEMLSESDQNVLVSLTAGSLDWAIDGRLDPYQIDQVLDDEAGLRERISKAGQPPTATDQPVSAIVSAPQVVLERFAQTHGLRLQYIEESENRAHGHYDDGPRALAQLQRRSRRPTRRWPRDGMTSPRRKKGRSSPASSGTTLPESVEQEIGDGACDFMPDEEITGLISGKPPSEAPEK